MEVLAVHEFLQLSPHLLFSLLASSNRKTALLFLRPFFKPLLERRQGKASGTALCCGLLVHTPSLEPSCAHPQPPPLLPPRPMIGQSKLAYPKPTSHSLTSPLPFTATHRPQQGVLTAKRERIGAARPLSCHSLPLLFSSARLIQSRRGADREKERWATPLTAWPWMSLL